MVDVQPPELWWSPTVGVMARSWDHFYRALGYGAGISSWVGHLPDLPADAGLLVPAEPVDEKGRTPTYLRGEADGWNAARAGVELADPGEALEWTEVHLSGQPAHPSDPPYDFTFRSDRDAWRHKASLLARSWSSWTDVRVRCRDVRQVTWASEWADQTASAAPETT